MFKIVERIVTVKQTYVVTENEETDKVENNHPDSYHLVNDDAVIDVVDTTVRDITENEYEDFMVKQAISDIQLNYETPPEPEKKRRGRKKKQKKVLTPDTKADKINTDTALADTLENMT